jgi:hypothetical protein
MRTIRRSGAIRLDRTTTSANPNRLRRLRRHENPVAPSRSACSR